MSAIRKDSAVLPPPAPTGAPAPEAGPRPSPGDSQLLTIVGPEDRRGYLPHQPWIQRDSSNRPIFSLTLLLTRRPGPSDHNIAGLIQQARLTLGISLAVPEETLAGIAVPPVYARSACFRLLDAPRTEVGVAYGSGPGAAGVISTILDGDSARNVLSALTREASGMLVETAVEFYDGPAEFQLSLEAPWADLHDAIARVAGAGEVFGADVVEQAVRSMRAAGTLRVNVTPTGLDEGDVLGLVLQALLPSAGLILTRVEGPGTKAYRLAPRPDERFVWAHAYAFTRSRTRTERLTALLEQVLGGILDGEDWSAFVHIISPTGDPLGGYAPAPRRVRGTAEAVGRDMSDDEPLEMAVLGSGMLAASAVTLTASPALKPVLLPAGVLRQQLLVDAMIAAVDGSRPRPLPIVTPGAVLMQDRLDPARWWYLPDLSLVASDPGVSADQSPFLFSFERVGATETGDEALRGTLRLTLRLSVSPQVRDALAKLGNPPSGPVEIIDLRLHLSIPFVNSNDGRLNRTALQAAVDRDGSRVVATFDVGHQWVRLLYGVLAYEGFQGAERARLAYSYRYAGYRVLRGALVKPVIGTKVSSLPVTWSASVAAGRTGSFDPGTGVLKAGSLKIRVAMEDEPPERDRRDASGSPRIAVAVATPDARAVSAGALHAATSAMRPLSVTVNPVLTDLKPAMGEKTYVQQSVGVQGVVDILMPCNQHGAFYRERVASPEGWRAIGCQDAFRLGRIRLKLFEEIPALATTWARVFRSLSQPGRFLLLPRAYCIARYPASHARPYQPAARIYAVLDAETPANNRYRFVAMLEPDVPEYALRELHARLCSYAPPPSIRIDLPTDVATQTDLPSMSLSSALSPPTFTVTGTGIQVALEADLAGALILRAALERDAIVGRLAFTISDSSRLESDVIIALARIAGPWRQGPVQGEWSASNVVLTNRIDRPVNVSEVRVYSSPSACIATAVGRRLSAGEGLEIAVACGPGEVTVVGEPVRGEGPASVEESRMFVEDISTTVVFTCGINYESRGMSDLEIYARLGGTGDVERRVALSNGLPRMGQITLSVPLFAAIGAGPAAAIEYRLVRITTAGERVETPWTVCQGALVDIVWEMVA